MRPLPPPKPAPMKRLQIILPALAVLALGACSSSPSKGDTLYGLDDEELLGVYFENALYYVELGDWNRVIDQATRALEIDPDNERFQMMFGRAHLKRGERDSIQMAIDMFEQMENQDDFRVQMSWGAAVERKGVFYEEASNSVRSGRRATEFADPIARADELAGEARTFWRDAQSKYERSLELRSGEPEPLNGLVRTSAYLGDYDASLKWSRELIDAVRASQRLVDMQMEEADMTASKESKLFRDQRTNRELEIKARLHIATLERQLGNLRASADQFDAIMALDPSLVEAHSLQAQVLFELGEYRRAKDAINRFIELKARGGASSVNDPEIVKAYDLVDRCDKELRREQRRRG